MTTDYSKLNDLQLCERIAELKGWKRKAPGIWVDGGGWVMGCYAPLSWEYAGRLLEEMMAAMPIEVSNVSCGYQIEWGNMATDSDRLPRAICEAYAMWREA